MRDIRTKIKRGRAGPRTVEIAIARVIQHVNEYSARVVAEHFREWPGMDEPSMYKAQQMLDDEVRFIAHHSLTHPLAH
jgi:hypothetical protein